MTQLAGPTGALQASFEDGLRFLATALAVQASGNSNAASVTTACDALRCFLVVLDAAATRHIQDPDGNVTHLRNQCMALLTLSQDPSEASRHAIEAACLARDQAAYLLPRLMSAD